MSTEGDLAAGVLTESSLVLGVLHRGQGSHRVAEPASQASVPLKTVSVVGIGVGIGWVHTSWRRRNSDPDSKIEERSLGRTGRRLIILIGRGAFRSRRSLTRWSLE